MITTEKAAALVAGLRGTLERQGLDHEGWIRGFGQVAASERRARGEAFPFREHVRGLLLSQLSSQRSWGPIAANMGALTAVFCDFDADRLLQIEPAQLAKEIFALRCGNRQLAGQMKALHANLRTLQAIEEEYGSMDAFVASGTAEEIAKRISSPGRYKLKYIGFTLAVEYLRNVGVRAGKPDVHVRRILSGERLGIADGVPGEEEALGLVASLAERADCNPSYLDNLLWIFCAQDYGNICRAQPRCEVCLLQQSCRYPAARI